MTDEQREVRHLRKYLRECVDAVSCVIFSIDQTMQGPSTPERGKRLAAATNALALARDSAAHFGLRQEWPEIARCKRKAIQRMGGDPKLAR